MTLAERKPSIPDRRARGHQGPRLFERGEFLAEFEAIFSRSLQVPSTCIAIEGTWGSGRTALINAATDAASRAGCLVLRARGGNVERQNPHAVLSSLVESAAVMADGHDPAVEQAHLIAQRLEALRTGRSDLGDVSALFHRLIVSLRELAPVLLVVDDADQADPETVAVLNYVVRRLENQQIWLLVSARHLHPGIGLRPIDGLLTEPQTRQFILEPLHAESVGTMLSGFFEQVPDAAFVTACHNATGGSPFFLKALLPSLVRVGVAPTAAMADRIERVPAPKITQFVLSRLGQLPVAASDLLQACAILGDEADPTVARNLAKIDALAAERAADAAAQMELLQPGRPFRFSSPLIRWAIYHDIPTGRRSQLHARAAQILDEHGAEDAAVAHHLLATEPAGQVEVAHRLQRMGRSALEAGHVDLALRCLERALAEYPPSDRGADLYLDLASAELARHGPSALTYLQRSLELGGADHAALIRVGVDLLEDHSHRPESRNEVAATLRDMRTYLDPVDRNLRIELELALQAASDWTDDRVEDLERLRVLLTEPGDDDDRIPLLARSVLGVHDALTAPSIGADELAAKLEQAFDPDQFVRSDRVAGRVQIMAVFGLLCADRFADVDDHLESALATHQGRESLPAQRRAATLAAVSHLWQGSLVEAEENCQQAEALGTRLDESGLRRLAMGHLDVLVKQGRIDEAERLLDSTSPTDPNALPFFRAWARIELGRLNVAQGRMESALEHFVDAGDEAGRAGILSPALISWRADAVMVLSAQEQWEEAGRLAAENLRLARSFGTARIIGTALRASAAATPDLEQRTAILAEAVAVLEPSPARLESAQALVDLGTALVARNMKEEARGVLRRGASLASLCSAHQLLEAAGDQLRAAGARPRRLGYVGPESLTPAELRVVRMAAKGQTNQRIADELFVTLKTVEGHLAKAYRKLGIDGRLELASVLSQRDDKDGDDEAPLRASAL
ncbi:MAG: LuxR C-terminal-related transcriptional regulator [Acidimicrobiales bacterium]|jgi:DNA-binding CsgD family transcriptional regulator